MDARNPGFVSSLRHCNQHQTHWMQEWKIPVAHNSIFLLLQVRKQTPVSRGVSEWMNRPAEDSSSEMEMVLASVENILENKCMICCFKKAGCIHRSGSQSVSATPHTHTLDRVWVGAGIVFFSLHLARWNHALSHTCSPTQSVHWPGALLFITLLILLLPADLVTAESGTETSGEVKHTAGRKEKSFFCV